MYKLYWKALYQKLAELAIKLWGKSETVLLLTRRALTIAVETSKEKTKRNEKTFKEGFPLVWCLAMLLCSWEGVKCVKP